ncbi:MAG: YitT family protein [Bacilli bacterium]|nr:YitT family protein [Bacilli bacterium]MDD4795810.1 YitT family protein [Bacilli bacterium]
MKESKSILNIVEKYNLLIRIIVFIVSVFLIAVNYNLVLAPNNLVIGGLSGLAIVVKQVTGLNTSIFIVISTTATTIIGFFFLERQKMYKILFGSVIFNIFVSLTEPLSKYITLEFNSQFIMILFAAVCYGICYGLVFRSGFIIGGSDTISAIISKYTKLPMGTSAVWTNIFIVLAGFIVFGLTKTVYGVFILLVSNKIVDIIILGVKDSKMCYIKSAKSDKILDHLLNNVNIGVTQLVGKGGIFTKTDPVLLVIVPFNHYYGLKHTIKKLDQDAFLVASDCHDVSGGYKKNLLPF